MATVLVTGASGFVGRPLVGALARAGHDVIAAARGGAPPAEANVRPVRLPDLAGEVDWDALLHGVTHVVHLAAIAHRGSAVADEVYERVNREAVGALAAAAARARVQRLLFVSSVASQVGASCERVISEADAPRPTTVYGRTKLAAEAAVRASGVPFTILRPVLIYGPQAPGNMGRLIRLAASPLWLPFAALTARRSLLGLDNLIAAIALGLQAPATAGETYLVADAQALTLPEIVTALRAGRGRPPRLVAVPPALCAAALKLAGRADLWNQLGRPLVVSSAKLQAAGWRPVVAAPEGLAASVRGP